MTSNDVLIVVGPVESSPRKTDLAAVGFGQKAAAQLGGAVDLLLMGPEAVAAAPAFAACGVRKVITIEHADLNDYTAEAYSSALAQFASQACYHILGGSTSSASRDFFPRVAARLDLPMASDILALNQLSADQAEVTRSVFVGNLLATLKIDAPQWIATCRASEFDPPTLSEQQAPIEAAEISGPLAHAGKRFVSLKQQTSDRPDLTEAEKIVSGGRGTKGADGLKIV
jgi:electron transfer flavoprotein alpha subunit